MPRHINSDVRAVANLLSLQTIMMLDHLYLTMVDQAIGEQIRHTYMMASFQAVSNMPPGIMQAVFDHYEGGRTLTAARL